MPTFPDDQQALTSHDTPRRRHRVPLAAIAGLAMAGLLIPFVMWVANMALWETVDFVKNWGYFVAGTAALGIGTGAVLRLCVLHRRWWFLCLPAVILWCLILFIVVAGRIDDSEDGFGFHCATIRCGESIENFADRMAAWGHSPPTYEEEEARLGCAVFQGDADTWFDVYFSRKTRKIVSWRYISV